MNKKFSENLIMGIGGGIIVLFVQFIWDVTENILNKADDKRILAFCMKIVVIFICFVAISIYIVRTTRK